MHFCYLYILFHEVSRCFARFLVGLFVSSLFDFKCSLYILKTSPLSRMCFTDIFLGEKWLVFFFFSNIFCKAEVFNFNEVLFINFFSHGLCAFVAVSKNQISNPRSCRIFPMFSSRGFIVLHFTFRFGPFLVNFCERC